MKPATTLLPALLLLTSCTSLTALKSGGEQQTTPTTQLSRAGNTLPVAGTSYPAVVVTPEGGHAVVMPPCGNTAVVVNPDGSHSIAVINGSTATIVTP